MSDQWPRLRLGATYDVRDQRAGAEGESLPLMSVSQIHGVVPRSELVGDQGRAEDLANYKICEPGDIVLNRMSAYNGALGVARERGVVSPDYLVMTPRATACPAFIAAWLKTPVGVFEMTSRLRGIGSVDAAQVRTPRVNESDLKTITLAMPPIEEQRVIADHLDHETARIDTLIREQQRLIDVLRERRVATVAEALEGHDTTHLRRLVDPERPMTYGILQAGEPVDGGVPYIGPSDIKGEGTSPARDAVRTTAPEIAAAYRRSVLAGGDVVVSIGPAYGKVAVVSDDLAGANLTQDTVRVALLPELADTRFVVWALLSAQTADYWDYQITGATFRRLNLGTLARTPIPLAPLDEQCRIANYLDEQTGKIDALIAETERFVELSKERRAALITATVTGQIDVRAVA